MEEKESILLRRPPHLAVHDVLQIGFTYFLLPTQIFQIHHILPSSAGPHANHTLPQAPPQATQAPQAPPPSSSVWKPSLGTIHEVVEYSLHSNNDYSH